MSKERRFFIGDREFFIPITPQGDYHTMARWVDHMNKEKPSRAGRWIAGGKDEDLNLLYGLGKLGVIDLTWFFPHENVVHGASWWRWANREKLLQKFGPGVALAPYKCFWTNHNKWDDFHIAHDDLQSFFLSTTNPEDIWPVKI